MPLHRTFFSPGNSIHLCSSKHLLAVQAGAVPEYRTSEGIVGNARRTTRYAPTYDSIDALFCPMRAGWPLDIQFMCGVYSPLPQGITCTKPWAGTSDSALPWRSDPTRPLAQEWTRSSRDGSQNTDAIQRHSIVLCSLVSAKKTYRLLIETILRPWIQST
jgi:hypothetical protein